MKNLFIFALLLFNLVAFAQAPPKEYDEFTKKAFSLYQAKDFPGSAAAYSKAFEANGWKAYREDRYNAACSWALAGNTDSAFFQLFRIATMQDYTDLRHLTSDTDLVNLYKDVRWDSLVVLVKANKDKLEANYDHALVHLLDSIYDEDQKYRKMSKGIEKQYGYDSPELKAHWKMINEKDSLNLIVVSRILDQRGWLGADVISEVGNSTLFLVIQHSDQKTQEKYLPMMREAVKNNKARGSSLALLEDRVALGQGKKQIYGSQIGRGPNGERYVLPLEDPDHVDERRATVGLPSLAEYVTNWGITWDVEQYKKDLPGFEKMQKANK